jgi:hypothetical protein
MVIAISFANFVAHSVSTTDYLPARSVPHRGGAVTDPAWWTYHSDWIAVFQWLVIPLPILAWHGGPPRGRRTLFACIPLLQFALQYVLVHRAIEGRLAIGLGLHALDAGLPLLIAAGLAAGLFD